MYLRAPSSGLFEAIVHIWPYSQQRFCEFSSKYFFAEGHAPMNLKVEYSLIKLHVYVTLFACIPSLLFHLHLSTYAHNPTNLAMEIQQFKIMTFI